MKKNIFTLLALLVCAVGSAWAQTTYNLIDRSGATSVLNTSDFRCTSPLKTGNTRTFTGIGDLTDYVQMGGAATAISGLYQATKYIAYDIKSSDVSFKACVYNSKNGAKNFSYAVVKEGESYTSPAPAIDNSIAASSTDIVEFSVSGSTKNTTVYFYVSDAVNIYQIEVVESGTPLPTGGTRGYELNLNKGRAAAESGNATSIDGIEFNVSSNVKVLDTSNAQIKTKGTHYVKFTTIETTKLTVTCSNNAAYFVTNSLFSSEENVSGLTSFSGTKDIELAAGTWYINPNGSNVGITKLAFEKPDVHNLTGAWKISDEDVTGQTANVAQGSTAPTIPSFTVVADAGNLSAGDYTVVYSLKDGSTEGIFTYTAEGGPTAISTATIGSATIIATLTSTDETVFKTPTTNTFEYTVSVSSSAAPSISIASSASAAVAKGTAVTLTATVDGSPDPTIQWYSNTTATNSGGTAISGETSSTYSPSTAAIGTFYYYAVATNSVSSVASNVVTLTIKGSNACTLNQVVFSNSFDAFITTPTSTSNGKVKAYYLEGTSEPTITSSKQSDGATVSTATAGKIIVTAEDGTTTATYDITIEAVTPFEGSSRVFDGSETWVKTGNAFSTASGKEGWVFSKNDTDWSRETPGKNRIYFFLAPSTTVTFANGGTSRNIKVYRNGIELSTPTSSGSCTIAGDTENAYMVAIVSNQTSGDGAFKTMTVTGSQKESITITCEGGYASYSCNRALDFTGSTAEAYIIKSTSENSATLTKVTKVPANTGIIVKGTKGESVNIAIATGATDDVTGNLLKATVNTPVAVEANAAYGLSKTDGKFHLLNDGTIPANKAYLLASEVFQASGAAVLDLDFEGETTGVNTLNVERGTLNGEVYNLNGQRVAQPTKGLYIVNGKKVLIK